MQAYTHIHTHSQKGKIVKVVTITFCFYILKLLFFSIFSSPYFSNFNNNYNLHCNKKRTLKFIFAIKYLS